MNAICHYFASRSAATAKEMVVVDNKTRAAAGATLRLWRTVTAAVPIARLITVTTTTDPSTSSPARV